MDSFQPLPWSAVTMRECSHLLIDMTSMHQRTTYRVDCFPKPIFLQKTSIRFGIREKVIWIADEDQVFEHAHQLKAHLIERGWVLPEQTQEVSQ